MAIDLQVKKGDTRNWVFTLSDTDSSALDLTSATVSFRLMSYEEATDTYFDRVSGSGGTGSDFITIGSPASGGQVTITPTVSDWTPISDNYGIYVGEFKVVDNNNDVQFTTDVEIDVQEALF